VVHTIRRSERESLARWQLLGKRTRHVKRTLLPVASWCRTRTMTITSCRALAGTASRLAPSLHSMHAAIRRTINEQVQVHQVYTHSTTRQRLFQSGKMTRSGALYRGEVWRGLRTPPPKFIFWFFPLKIVLLWNNVTAAKTICYVAWDSFQWLLRPTPTIYYKKIWTKLTRRAKAYSISSSYSFENRISLGLGPSGPEYT